MFKCQANNGIIANGKGEISCGFESHRVYQKKEYGTMKNGQIEFWACYHDDLGFLKFDSYGKASVSKEPLPRGLYKEQAYAEMHKRDRFWANGNNYDGSEIKVVKVTFDWKAEF